MIIWILRIFALICTAVVFGKLTARLKLPAILGWLVAGIVFGPYLAGVVTADICTTMISILRISTECRRISTTDFRIIRYT